jgi:hypothetical protein
MTEPKQTLVPSNVEQEAEPVVVVVSRGGEARTQKGRLRGRTAGRDLLTVVQKKENEEYMLDVQKGEKLGSSKSETRIGMEAVAIETIERKAEDLRMDHNKRQNWM